MDAKNNVDSCFHKEAQYKDYKIQDLKLKFLIVNSMFTLVHHVSASYDVKLRVLIPTTQSLHVNFASQAKHFSNNSDIEAQKATVKSCWDNMSYQVCTNLWSPCLV